MGSKMLQYIHPLFADEYPDDAVRLNRDQEIRLLQQSSCSFPSSPEPVPIRYEGYYKSSSMFFESASTDSDCSAEILKPLTESMSEGHQQTSPNQSPIQGASTNNTDKSQSYEESASETVLLQPPQAIITDPARNMVSLAPNPGPAGSSQHGGSLVSNTQRCSRRQAEKQRRDRMNSSYSIIGKHVTMTGASSKRMDKISMLRLTAADFRLYLWEKGQTEDENYSGGGPMRRKRKWRPSYMGSDQLSALLGVLEGFVLASNLDGKILYVSDTVDRYLGHQNIDMMGHTIFNFLHKADVQAVREKIQSTMSLASNFKLRDDKLVSHRISFFCRIREKTQPRAEVITFQVIHVEGHLSGPAPSVVDPQALSDGLDQQVQLDPAKFKLIVFIRIIRTSPCKRLTLTDAVQNEYVTRHKLDGTIIFADHRIYSLTGHMPKEVTGTSAHKYMDQNDLVIALFAQKQMFASETGKGTVVYRLRTKENKFIYLRSAGQLEYDQSTMQVDHFVCVNTLLSDEDGERERLTLCSRYQPHIANTALQNLQQFITSVHANALKRLHTSKEAVAINSTRHVPGGHARNPLALENIVEPNLYLGSNCLVKLKESGIDDTDDDYYDERKRSHISERSFKSDYATSPAGRQPCSSPEMVNSPTPTTPSTSPLSIETNDLTQIMQGKFSVPPQYNLPNRSTPSPYPVNQWNLPHGNGPVGMNHRSSSASTGGYSAQLSSPSSMASSPMSDDVHHVHPHL